MEKNLKPFDLEAAKAGAKVVARDGSPVRIICFDAAGVSPIVGLVSNLFGETPVAYMENGCLCLGEAPYLDLRMAPVKQTGWVNIYRNGDEVLTSTAVYATQEEAMPSIRTEGSYIATVPVEWEE
ncbi:hypothetical protein [Rikenella microfusus]|uniref:Uncharacterized protein n=1 Tax=Rikenella microfusus TaxID=28139 RepID=A0A379MPR1_9BACT|nr:hypothetical protein [Rikenella microfusus]SUE33641.1 Uncharacterised protein [Rikenella microfusus]